MAGLGGAIDEAADFCIHRRSSTRNTAARRLQSRRGGGRQRSRRHFLHPRKMAASPSIGASGRFSFALTPAIARSARAVFREMCQIIGVEVGKYIR